MAFCFLLAAITLLTWFAREQPAFIVVAGDDGEVIFKQEDVKPGYRFSTTFKHSVQLSDWTDYYEITDDFKFRLYETRFSDFGWGFPSEPDPEAKMEITPDYIRYYDMQRVMDSFTMVVTTAADKHILDAGSVQLDLIEKAGAGRFLEFRITGRRSK